MLRTLFFGLCAVLALGTMPGCRPGDDTGGLQEKTEGDSVVVEVNSLAPAFAARTLDGSPVRLADLVGTHVVLLEFWSIFCKSCLEEMPHVEELHRRYADDGLAVLSVNTDVFSATRIASFLRKAGISPPYPVVRDPRQEIVQAYNVELLPVTVIVDREGWIRLYQEGYRPGDERAFEAKVRSLLRKGEAEDVTLASRGGATAFAPAGVQLARPGQVVGPLRAADLTGRSVELAPGRPALLFFWSLYCRPCRGEYPQLVALSERYRSRGLASYAVNVDSTQLLTRVERFVAPHAALPCLLDDPVRDDGDLSQALGVRVTPTVVLVDAGGRVAHAQAGDTDLGALEARIEALLGGQ